MSIENSADSYREKVLEEVGLTYEVFLARLLFFIHVESGCSLHKIEKILERCKGVKHATLQTLQTWSNAYAKRKFRIKDKRSGRVRGCSDYYKSIVSTFIKEQFPSAREMSRRTGLPLSTICYNLNQSGMRYIHFRKVPYILQR